MRERERGWDSEKPALLSLPLYLSSLSLHSERERERGERDGEIERGGGERGRDREGEIERGWGEIERAR